jgi:hypothetical protein
MEPVLADMSAILAIGAAIGVTLPAKAGRATIGPVMKLAIARIDSRRANNIRIFTVLV